MRACLRGCSEWVFMLNFQPLQIETTDNVHCSIMLLYYHGSAECNHHPLPSHFQFSSCQSPITAHVLLFWWLTVYKPYIRNNELKSKTFLSTLLLLLLLLIFLILLIHSQFLRLEHSALSDAQPMNIFYKIYNHTFQNHIERFVDLLAIYFPIEETKQNTQFNSH